MCFFSEGFRCCSTYALTISRGGAAARDDAVARAPKMIAPELFFDLCTEFLTQQIARLALLSDT